MLGSYFDINEGMLLALQARSPRPKLVMPPRRKAPNTFFVRNATYY